MKNLLVVFNIVLITSCSNDRIVEINQFDSYKDTLVIRTEKIKGNGPFHSGAGTLKFVPLSEYVFIDSIILPSNVIDPLIGEVYLDFKQFSYQRFLHGEIDKGTFLKSYASFAGDTNNFSIKTVSRNYFPILLFMEDSAYQFIVDQNWNLDFRDDITRTLDSLNWFPSDNLIGVEHEIFNGYKVDTVTSWLNIGTRDEGSRILKFFSQHYVADLSVSGDRFSIAVHDWQCKANIIQPEFCLTTNQGISKDTIFPGEILKLGEYLKLGDYYYKIEKISNDGGYLTLIKSDDIASKVGTQVGMIAPDFTFQTIDSKTISKEDYNNEYLLIANTTMCYSREDLFQIYKQFTDRFNNKVKFVCLNYADTIFKNLVKEYDLKGDIVLLSKESAIKGLEYYRPGFSSRECFLIDHDGYIIDKFNLFDWESHMLKQNDLK